MATDTYNKVFTMHGIIHDSFFSGAVGAGHAGQLPYPDDDRGQGLGAAQGQPA